MCPSKHLGMGVCDETCFDDSDCPNDEKCCSNRCGRQCMALSTGMLYKCTGHIFLHYSDSFSDLVSLLCVCITEKPGVCPRGFDGVRLCKELCVNDIDCPNDEKCCRTKCGHSCTSPF